jgi:hypothetical protein
MKKRITAILMVTMLILTAILFPFASTTFSDMENHWAKENVEKLRSMGIIDGYEDGTFKPENTVTYGEFIKMLVVAVTGENPGVSIDGSHWASGYYKAALENNLLKKEDIPEKFLPNKIPRADMAYLASKCVNDNLTAETKNSIESYITDIDKAKNRKEEVIIAYGMGILAGYPDKTFKPSGVLTRAESAAVISRIIDPSLRIEIDFEDEKPTPGTREPMVLRYDDPNRPIAIEGDTFIKPDGTEVVLKIGPSGVLGEGQGVATEIGRAHPNGELIEHGDLGSNDQFLGQPYYVDDRTGEGHYRREWHQIADYYRTYVLPKIEDPQDYQWYGDYFMYYKGQWYWDGPNDNS